MKVCLHPNVYQIKQSLVVLTWTYTMGLLKAFILAAQCGTHWHMIFKIQHLSNFLKVNIFDGQTRYCSLSKFIVNRSRSHTRSFCRVYFTVKYVNLVCCSWFFVGEHVVECSFVKYHCRQYRMFLLGVKR